MSVRLVSEGVLFDCCLERGVLDQWGARLSNRGVTDVVLAGLSNGGVGAAQLARSSVWKRHGVRLRGVVLVSGVARVAPPRSTEVLVLHGRRDRMASAAPAKRYGSRAGRRGRYVGLAGGHFILITKHDEVQREFEAFALRVDAKMKRQTS